MELMSVFLLFLLLDVLFEPIHFPLLIPCDQTSIQVNYERAALYFDSWRLQVRSELRCQYKFEICNA